MSKLPKLKVLQLEQMPIFEQLQMEEALLRADSGNWCILNSGSPPAIVMGISGKPETLIHQEKWQKQTPLIRRFSGGGTVVVNPDTFFISFICNRECTGVNCFPGEVHCWAKKHYASLFPGLGFDLRENDYVIGERKFGGNAQYLQKNRWLHHTTLLWDYDPAQMEYLLHPPKTPKYRLNRSHEEFLCRLKDYVEDKALLEEGILSSLRKEFDLEYASLETVREVLTLPHRKATIRLD